MGGVVQPRTQTQGFYMLRVVGLDLSLTATGASYLSGEPDSFTLTDSTILKSPKRGVYRLSDLLDSLLTFLDYHDKPDLVMLEGYSMGSRGRVFDLAEWGGIVRLYLSKLEIPTAIVPPKSLKLFTCENGNAQKPDMLKQANRLLSLQDRYYLNHPIKNDNLADAVALAYMGIHYYPDFQNFRDQPALRDNLDNYYRNRAGRVWSPKQQKGLSAVQPIVWGSRGEN